MYKVVKIGESLLPLECLSRTESLQNDDDSSAGAGADDDNDDDDDVVDVDDAGTMRVVLGFLHDGVSGGTALQEVGHLGVPLWTEPGRLLHERRFANQDLCAVCLKSK